MGKILLSFRPLTGRKLFPADAVTVPEKAQFVFVP